MSIQKKLFTADEIARHCEMSQHIVERWVNRNRPHHPGRPEQKVSLEDFIEFINENDLPSLSKKTSTRPSVLIVDDEENAANSIGRVFINNGFDILLAQNGFKAGILLKQESPQIVTIDISMQDLDGYDVLSIIQNLKMNPKVWVIVISGNSESSCERAIELGGDFYLRKPFSKYDLEKIILKIYPKTA